MMEEEAGQRKYNFAEALGQRGTDRMWRIISAAAEAAFVRYFDLTGEAAKMMRGRGVVTVRRVTKRPGRQEYLQPTEDSAAYEQIAAI